MSAGIMSTTIKLTPVKEIALIGILAAINITSRIYMQFLPNVKPVTSIIILSVLLFGLAFGIKLTIVTTIVSNVFLGMGIWTVFQILSWIVICVLTQLVATLFRKREKEPPFLFMAIFSLVMGYVFGFVVSFEQFLYGGIGLFLPYWIAGLMFDTLHAGGNFAFYLLIAPILTRVIRKEASKLK